VHTILGVESNDILQDTLSAIEVLLRSRLVALKCRDIKIATKNWRQRAGEDK
jgi:hypothetical protein